MNSKWNYICCGLNLGLAFLGVLVHNAIVILLGVFFGFFNWTIGEARRKIEEQEYGKNNEENKQ